MSQQDMEAANGETCSPEWIHVHHLVSYCARPVAGLDGRDNAAQADDNPSTFVCRRQNCVFRMQRR